MLLPMVSLNRKRPGARSPVLFHGVEVPFRKGCRQGDAAFLGIHHAHGQLEDVDFRCRFGRDAQRFSGLKVNETLFRAWMPVSG